jgi:hypothetical protein
MSAQDSIASVIFIFGGITIIAGLYSFCRHMWVTRPKQNRRIRDRDAKRYNVTPQFNMRDYK